MKRVIGGREDRGAHDYWGCVADYDHELAEEAKREAHEIGTCQGSPRCDYCQAEVDTAAESFGVNS